VNKDEIKKVLLEAAGNPVSGAVKEIADAQAEALERKLSPKSAKAKETRVVESEETR